MKAILKIDMPKNCAECVLPNRRYERCTDGYYVIHYCNLVFTDVSKFRDNIRYPDCPLQEADLEREYA